MARKNRSKGRSVAVDFSEAGTGRIKEEGDYLIKPIKIELEEGEKAQYLAWEYEVTEGKHKGATLYNNTSLSAKSLWALRDVLEAHSINAPEKAMDLDLDDIIENAEIAGCCVELETFQGKKKARITDIFAAEDVDSSDEDDDSDDDDDGEELPTEEEVNDMDLDELEECVDDNDLNVDLDDATGKGKKKLAAQRQMVIDALEKEDDEEDDEENEDEEDESYTKDAIMEMKAKELEAVVEEHELDVELEGKIKAKRKTVIAALEEEDLLVEED
jgi:hypothetical protein